MDRSACIAALSALGHETRLDVFRLLVRAGPGGLPAGEIGQHLGVRQNTMSTHLAVLHQVPLARDDGVAVSASRQSVDSTLRLPSAGAACD